MSQIKEMRQIETSNIRGVVSVGSVGFIEPTDFLKSMKWNPWIFEEKRGPYE